MKIRPRGFTLIELMIVVAIIGILAAVAVPKFSDLIRKSKEGATKGNLGGLRSALNIYYAENEGIYPSGAWSTNSSVLTDSLVPRHIKEIPPVDYGLNHAKTANVLCHLQNNDSHDGYGWGYDGYQPADSQYGSLWIYCTHTDTKGLLWSSY
jgi:prepilin-type N-terminal cleavage/methylation domain-containing protein